MKRFLFPLVILSMGLAPMSPAFAHERAPAFKRFSDSHRATGTVIESYPVYSNAGSRTKRVCQDVKVPIYANNGTNPNDVVAGAVIGGILGKIATGKNDGALAGAVIGGAVAADKSRKKITGYRIERQCDVVEVNNDRIEYYESRIRIEGRIYRVRTTHGFRTGQSINMWVHN